MALPVRFFAELALKSRTRSKTDARGRNFKCLDAPPIASPEAIYPHRAVASSATQGRRGIPDQESFPEGRAFLRGRMEITK
jgi:hypothetical protein